jgi:hypothetical protein
VFARKRTHDRLRRRAHARMHVHEKPYPSFAPTRSRSEMIASLTDGWLQLTLLA